MAQHKRTFVGENGKVGKFQSVFLRLCLCSYTLLSLAAVGVNNNVTLSQKILSVIGSAARMNELSESLSTLNITAASLTVRTMQAALDDMQAWEQQVGRSRKEGI